MSLGSGPDEVLIIEEQVERQPGAPGTSRGASWPRVVGIVAGSVGLSVATAVIVRRLVGSRRGIRGMQGKQGMRGQMGGARPIVLPRVALFAPSMTIALPFSQVIVPQRPRGLAGMRRRGRGGFRPVMAVQRGRGQRMSSSPAQQWRRARQVAGK